MAIYLVRILRKKDNKVEQYITGANLWVNSDEEIMERLSLEDFSQHMGIKGWVGNADGFSYCRINLRDS